MKVQHAPETRRRRVWRCNIEHAVYDHACTAMESRPDYPEMERLWAALNERFTFMQQAYDPAKHEDLLYQMDLTELADEAGIDDDAALSHLYTMLGAGLFAAVVEFMEYNAISVVIAPHMVAR